MHHAIRHRLIAAASLIAVASVLPAAPASSQVTAPQTTANGPILVRGFPNARLYTLAQGAFAQLSFPAGPAAVFSPDGSKIAMGLCEDPDCTSSTVVVRSNTGETKDVATVSGMAESITWSPDATHLAVSTAVTDEDGSISVDAIRLISVSSGSTTTLVADSPDRRLQFGRISWRPTGDEIAFVSSHFDGGGETGSCDNCQQVYTVSTDGAIKRYNSQLAQVDCRVPCTTYWFHDPTWSPDGSRLAVGVDEQYSTEEDTEERPYVGLLERGAATPSKVVDAPYNAGAIWAPDGSALLFEAYDDSFARHTYVKTLGGATRALPDDLWALSWQPCPGGACAAWARPDVSPRLTLSVTSERKVVARGRLTPSRAGMRVSVTLQNKSGKRWVTVDTGRPRLDAKSRYSSSFAQPPLARCRVVASWAGDRVVPAVRTTKTFTC